MDRSLGRVRLPALLRASDWTLVTLSEHYGVPQDETIGDVEWLQLAGEQGLPVLMKDERIKYRTAERQALTAHGVRAFCLTSGNLTSQAMAECFIRHQDRIWSQAVEAGPVLFAVSKQALRVVSLDQ